LYSNRLSFIDYSTLPSSYIALIRRGIKELSSLLALNNRSISLIESTIAISTSDSTSYLALSS